jgi:hypothetical protein
MLKGSWKTTLLGIGGALTVLGGALVAQFDNDPNTVIDFTTAFAQLAVSFGLIFARDNDKKSEDVGLK